MTGAKAIQTEFRGVLYRSRLEARWAVAFSEMGIAFEYEREGFDLGQTGYYLPDFWLPKQQMWIEIKGQQPTDKEQERCAALAEATGYPVILFPCTIPVVDDMENVRCPSDGCDGAYLFDQYGSGDNYYRWCVCPDCGLVGLKFDGRSDRLHCKECYHCWSARSDPSHSPNGCARHGVGARTGCPRHASNGDKGYTPGHPTIARAFTAARSARFEYGESGAPRRSLGGIPRPWGAVIPRDDDLGF